MSKLNPFDVLEGTHGLRNKPKAEQDALLAERLAAVDTDFPHWTPEAREHAKAFVSARFQLLLRPKG